MQLSELIAHLTLNPAAELAFEFPDGPLPRDFHLTEVLRIRIDAIDCGGRMDTWSETVLQLVESAVQDDARFMPASKAMAILQRSNAQLALDPGSEVLLEYQPAGRSQSGAQRFRIAHGHDTAGRLTFHAVGTTTQCKAAERSQTVCGGATQSRDCCAPVHAAKAPKGSCCTPSAEADACCARA